MDAQYIRQEVADAQFIFLGLFTISGQGWPLFIFFMAGFLPIVGIVLGFDSINNEHSSGTMSRLLSQPIYRDAVINGKFLAGVATIAIMLTGLMLLVAGIGLTMIGIPPTSEEAGRLLFFLIIAIIYGAFWLEIAMLFSIFFRRVATSALAGIAAWLFAGFLFMFPLLFELGEQQFGLVIMHLSPITLFWQVTTILLVPSARTVGQLARTDVRIPSSALSIGQSLLTVWPYLMSIIMLTVVCFAIAYIKFMREEIRST
jgi:ABC-2 type transport system permease protein